MEEYSKKSQLSKKSNQPTGFLPQKLITSIFLLFIFILSGCQTGPKNYSDSGSGHWQMKALVKAKGKTQLFNLDLKAIDTESVRMDILSTLGTHEASMYIGTSEMQILTVRNKSFYQGKPSSKNLYKLTKLPLDPSLLHYLLFDKAIADKGWVCTQKDNLPQECKNLKTKESIVWKNRRGTKKLMVFKSPDGLLQMNITEFKGEIDPGKVKKLSPPKNFKIIAL